MKKHLLSLLCLLTFALPGLAEVKSITLKPSDFGSGSSYIKNETKKTIDGIEFGVCYINPNNGQIKKGDFYLYNNTEMPGYITKVEIVEKSGTFTPNTTYLNLGDEPISGKQTSGNITGTETTVNGTKVIVLNATGNSKYFNLSGNIVSGNSYASSIVVYYDESSSLPTTCTPPIFNIEHNSKVPVGTVVRATCDTPNSTVTITGLGADAVVGEEKAGYAEVTISEEYLGQIFTLKATATVEGENGPIESDSTSIDIDVVEAPKTISDIITLGANSFDFSGSYSLKKYDSSATKVSYYGKGMKSYEVMQINTGFKSSSSNYKCGIISEENPDNLIIESVKVTRKTPLDDGSKDDKVIITLSNTPGSHTGNVNGTGTSVSINTPNDGITVTGIGDSETKTYTPQGDYKYFSLTTSGNQYIVSVEVNYRKPEAPETTDVTLAWGEMAKEFTVGEIGVTGELTVEPAEALPFVNVTSSNAEVATAEFDAETGLVELNFLKASAEPVVITATVDDPNGKFVAKENATFSFTVKDAEVVLEPEAIVVTPALNDDRTITVTEGTKITFSSKNADKLCVSIDSADATLEANPFVFTATEETTIEIIPVDSEGKRYEVLKLKAYIYIEEVIEPEKATTTYTFDFTKDSLIDKDNEIYNNPSSMMYFRSEGAGIFDIFTQIMDGAGTLSYLDNIGWKYGTDLENGAEYYISVYPHDGLDYSITSIKFNYSADFDTLIDFSDMYGNSIENGLWTGTKNPEGFKVLALDEFILNSIDVTFEHDVVPTPIAAWKDEHHFTLSHEKGYDIYYKIENVVDNPQFRAINRDEMYEGHNSYNDNDELSLYSGQRLSLYAQHPHGMVSKLLSATYDEIVTGIGSIAADSETEVVYFNLQGVRVAEPTDGVYIRVANGKATKVIK